MRSPGLAKVQHYVPRFLLRNFGTGKKDQLHVFDKLTGRTFVTNAKNVAAESGFYDFRVADIHLTLEPSLARLEGRAKQLLDAVLRQETTAALSDADRRELSAFFAVQFTRTLNFRQRWRSLPEMLSERLRSQARTPDQLASVDEAIPIPDENELKAQTARILMEAPKDFGPHFASKDWYLLSTTRKHPFYVNDNPLTLQNAIDMRPYGNIGLAVKGIEIYMPLTPVRALAMWCPTITASFVDGAQTIQMLRRGAPHVLSSKVKDPEGIEAIAASLRARTALPYKPENVMNFNSLQVSNAERYVFSADGDFTLPRRMLAEQPSLRTGPRMQLG